MTVFDVIKINEHLLSFLGSNSVEIKDVKHLRMYEEFQQMKAEGEKINYIVAELADRYEIGERTVWRVIEKFGRAFEIAG